MHTLGYDPQFYPQREQFDSDADYIGFHIDKTHDIHHILTGFSLDTLGELGVISVTVAQTRYPTGSSRLCVIIFAYGIVKCLSGNTFRTILSKKLSV
jgi:ubiquinone biosynthesis protein Coq4